MKKLIVFLLLSTALCSCKKETKNLGFTLKGMAKNYPDSTQINFTYGNRIQDSTYIIGEKFEFKGLVDEPSEGAIFIPKSRNYATIWLENSEMTFEAEKDKFREAIITGSETQKDYDTYLRITEPYQKLRQIASKQYRNKDISKSEKVVLRRRMDSLKKKKSDTTRFFIRKFSNSPVSVSLINTSNTSWKKDTIAALFAGLTSKMKQSKDGKNVSHFLEVNKNPRVGDQYADFALSDPNGQMIKVSDIKKKYTLIEFWAAWCGPCRKSNPQLVKTYKKYASKGFEIIGVSLDEDKNDWLKAIKKDSLTWPHVSDLKGWGNEAYLIYGVVGIPDNFLINENGKIVARRLRGEKLDEKLDELFNLEKELKAEL